MKEKQKKAWSPMVTVLLFAFAALLLLGSSIGGARAALTYYSENYVSRVQMHNIGVSLVENGEKIAWRDYKSSGDGRWDVGGDLLLGNMLAEGEAFLPGKAYEEVLAVDNSGTIDQYVRVSIYKYWLDQDGNKLRELSPELIRLNLINQDSWILDPEASTPERTVLYYRNILASGTTSLPFCDTLTVDSSIADKVTKTTETENGSTVITTTYDYNGVQFRVKAKVDAVQDHNGEDAIWSAWGRKVSIDSNGALSLR